MRGNTITEVAGAYLDLLPAQAPLLLVLAALPVLALYARLRKPAAPLLALGLVLGLAGAVRRASLVDDAFISFRYARNFADGYGLVWNLGERVEGYTNFLWTLVIGLLHRGTPWEAPEIGLALSLAALVGNLLIAFELGARLSAPQDGQRHVPLAVLALALHPVFLSFGTTGLETGFAALLVQAGLLALLSDHSGLAGLLLIAAALTRPDHGLFWVVGGVALAAQRRDPQELARYALTFLPLVLHLAWRLNWYGEWSPTRTSPSPRGWRGGTRGWCTSPPSGSGATAGSGCCWRAPGC